MNYFQTRYQAQQAFPNAIIRKIRDGASHMIGNSGDYVIFNDYTTYEQWYHLGYVRK